VGSETKAGTGTKMSLYEAINVWKRISAVEVVCYRCFKDLETNLYSVQSADFYRLPLNQAQTANLERQYVELLAEQSPDERDTGFASLKEAIAAHNRDFEKD
jgi:hypothetical protein